MDLSIIIVHYKATSFLLKALTSLTRDLAGTALRAEIIVVDNNPAALDSDTISRMPARYLSPGANLGFAGGVNYGVQRSRGRYLVFMNPDVEPLPGCLQTLVSFLEENGGAVGPRFYLDHRLTFMLPPTELRNRFNEVVRNLSNRSRMWAGLGRRLWRRHAQRFCQARRPLVTPFLSGAMIGTTRRVWQQVGPMDDGFKLYFEESDWLLRLQKFGFRSYYLPQARAVHHFNQSALLEPLAGNWFQLSQKRFNRRHYGAWFCRMLEWLPHIKPSPLSPLPCLPIQKRFQLPLPTPSRYVRYPLFIELSYYGKGFPAAVSTVAEASAEGFCFGGRALSNLAPSAYQLLVVDSLGTELTCHHFEWCPPPGD